jgi:hypothetical protein
VRTSPTINGSPIDGYVCRAPAPAGFIATRSIVLMLLTEAHDVVQIGRATGWPTRQVRLLASRNGYLFTPHGTPYQPPAIGQRFRRRHADVRVSA